MKKNVGLWIDHKKAVIVFVTGKEEEIRVISAIDERQGHSGASMPADDIRQRKLTGHLNTFYDEVVSCIREVESVLIFGPGEAKGELKKRLEKNNLSAHIVGLEAADTMTEPQIAAQVREHFLNQRTATSSR